jgi:hypothetical protein
MTRSELARGRRPLAGDRSLREQARSYGRAGVLRKLRSIQATPVAHPCILSAVVISYHHTGHGEVVPTRRPLSLCCR